MHSQLPSEHSRLRLLAEWCLYFLIAAVVFRTWLIEGLVIPCKVAGGSMASTLLGPHREVVCADCGARFSCGTDSAALDGRAVCPNCGYSGNDLASAPALFGDGVLLHKSIFRLRSPRRWEVAALRRPDRAEQLLVKRVVGLPGESVRIDHGDLIVDGQVQRKDLAQQRALAVLVHDASLQPKRRPVPPLRWRGEGPDSRWGSVGGRFAHSPNSDDEATDWLVYHHAHRMYAGERADRPPEVVESPITDRCAYNQLRPRRDEDVHPVSDLMLSLCLVEARGQGLLILRATDGRDEFQTRLDPIRGRYEILRNGRPVPAAIGRIPPFRDELSVEFSLFDEQLLLAFDGEVRVQWPYDPSPGISKPSSQPLAIGARGLGVVIRDLTIYRDVYYARPLGPHNPQGVDEPLELGEDQYYVLGDNSPISEDSRTWTAGPAVPASLLVGKPLCVHFPAKRVQIGGWDFQVPDPARIRYVR